jgi:hypothetical protein
LLYEYEYENENDCATMRANYPLPTNH